MNSSTMHSLQDYDYLQMHRIMSMTYSKLGSIFCQVTVDIKRSFCMRENCNMLVRSGVVSQQYEFTTAFYCVRVLFSNPTHTFHVQFRLLSSEWSFLHIIYLILPILQY